MNHKIQILEKYGGVKVLEKDLVWIMNRLSKLKHCWKFLS